MTAPADASRRVRRPGARALLAWYEPRRFAYPWRRTTEPYAVLVSEVMLQQTQAPRVVRAFERFIETFPTIGALSRASTADVVRVWGGLGYNRRAVALSRTATEVVERHGGRIPRDPAELRRLPGIGPYTAAAVTSIAFGAPVAAVDTNVRRIVGRVFAATERSTDEVASAWVHRSRPGDWNQALMDLGREVCRPIPRCSECPLRRACLAGSVSGTPPWRPVRAQPAFEGSFRQLRGAIVRELRSVPSSSPASLARATGRSAFDVERAVDALARDGLVVIGTAAPPTRPTVSVRLAT